MDADLYPKTTAKLIAVERELIERARTDRLELMWLRVELASLVHVALTESSEDTRADLLAGVIAVLDALNGDPTASADTLAAVFQQAVEARP